MKIHQISGHLDKLPESYKEKYTKGVRFGLS